AHADRESRRQQVVDPGQPRPRRERADRGQLPQRGRQPGRGRGLGGGRLGDQRPVLPANAGDGHDPGLTAQEAAAARSLNAAADRRQLAAAPATKATSTTPRATVNAYGPGWPEPSARPRMPQSTVAAPLSQPITPIRQTAETRFQRRSDG